MLEKEIIWNLKTPVQFSPPRPGKGQIHHPGKALPVKFPTTRAQKIVKCPRISRGGINGAETNCGIAHILGILLMNSCNTDIFFSYYYHLQSVGFELLKFRFDRPIISQRVEGSMIRYTIFILKLFQRSHKAFKNDFGYVLTIVIDCISGKKPFHL